MMFCSVQKIIFVGEDEFVWYMGGDHLQGKHDDSVELIYYKESV